MPTQCDRNVFGHINDKSTPSRPLGEVKLVRARLVVRWVTTCEARVLKAHLVFYFDSFFLFIYLILLSIPCLLPYDLIK